MSSSEAWIQIAMIQLMFAPFGGLHRQTFGNTLLGIVGHLAVVGCDFEVGTS